MFLLLKCAVTGQQVILSVVLVPNLDKWGDLHQKGHELFAKSNMWIINNFHSGCAGLRVTVKHLEQNQPIYHNCNQVFGITMTH